MNKKKELRKPGPLRIITTTPAPKKGWGMIGWELVSSPGTDPKKVPQYWENGRKQIPVESLG